MGRSVSLNKDGKNAGKLPVDVVSAERMVKDKQKKILDILKGMTVAQAKLVLDIVSEDFSANAVISD